MQLRFRTPAPDDVKAAVEGTNDAEVLNRWFDLAATAESLEEFRAAMAAT